MSKAQSAVIFGMAGTSLSPEEIAFFGDVQPYGFILFARNCASPQQVCALIAQLKKATGRAQLPILIDQEGGRVARLKPPHWPAFPPAKMFDELYRRDPAKATRATYLNARLIAHELSALGITVDCAPVADVPVAGAHDVIGDRAFGHTPQQVAILARAQAQGLQDGGVVSVLKHIPGHGRSLADSHEQLPEVHATLAELRASDFMPFKMLADLPMAMTAHVLYPALDEKNMATLSLKIIALIREEIGFAGLLMSDDISMKAMRGDFTQRAREALAAGCDVVLHCNGDMAEMRAVAKGVAALSGASLARAQAAMKHAGKPTPFDMMAARQECAQLLAETVNA
jgi:beta-N-acetylhexosaminidase